MLMACSRIEAIPLFRDTGPEVRDPIEAEVGCVVDGDTFKLEDCTDTSETVRLYGADTPEVYTDDGVPECYAELASEYTRGLLVAGQRVQLTFDVCTTDPYGRTLAYVWVLGEGSDTDDDAEGLFLNEDLLRRGYARLYREDVGCATDIQYFELFEQLEQSAQASNAGLWGACGS